MKILMRMGSSPFKSYSLYDVCSRDTIGTNSGNLLFPYAILRNIYKDGMQVDAYPRADPRDAERINREYDLFLIPMANAFRADFAGELENFTQLIRSLSIPCVVVGVGLQTNYEPGSHLTFSFDQTVRDFLHAVLEKSSSVGVRGEITAAYLKNLGVAESKISVIGCPSMYLWGGRLPHKEQKGLTKETRIALSYHGKNQNYYAFLEKIKEKFPDYCYILQKIYELRLLYAGIPVPEAYRGGAFYVSTPDAVPFRENRMRMFINVPSWIDFVSGMDFAAGSCIHGSIASVLAGNPTMIFAADARVRELAQFHHIPMMKMSDIDNRTDIRKLYEKADFSDVLRGQESRYQNFRDFLQENQISCPDITEISCTDFDRKMAQTPQSAPQGAVCYTSLPLSEQKEHLSAYRKLCKKKIKWYKKNAVKEGKEKYASVLTMWEEAEQSVLANQHKLGR